jgi:choline monooxygenase
MDPSLDIFHPSHYAAVRRPLDEAGHLPAWCYTSDVFYQREVETIFRKEWIFLGRADHIPNPGDYFTIEHTGVPLIVLRDRQGELRVFANSCRHRGAKLLEGEGHCASHIACPYHSWSYALDGRLVAAPGMQGVKNFELKEYGLAPVRRESWGGFLFINFDREAPGLTAYLGDLTTILESYDFSSMACTRYKSYELQCNWKLPVENGLEDYHTATVHRSSIGTQTIEVLDGEGNWEVGFFESERSIGTLPGEPARLPWIPTLEGRARRGTHFTLIYPCGKIACTQDGIFWSLLYPRGPARTDLVVGFGYPRSTVAHPDFEATVAKYYHRCDVSIPEDNAIAEVQQRGLNSPLAQPSRVSLREPIVNYFANWVLDRVLADPREASRMPRGRHAA